MPDGVRVLDTSVAALWFFADEPLRDEALAVMDRLRASPSLFLVPHIFHSELVHVLARKSGRDARFVEEGLRLVLGLGIRTVSLPERALRRTAHWACRGLGGYDGTFVALAEEVGGRWLTADERAARVAPRIAETLSGWKPGSRS